MSEQNQGSTLFGAFLADNALAVAKAADELGVTRAVLYLWLSGAQRPRPDLRLKIEVWTGGKVPAVSWMTDAERAELAAVEPYAPPPVET